MGKSRGGKSKGYKGSKGKREGDEDEGSEEEFVAKPRGLGGQSSNVGMLPPSDSDEDEQEAKPKKSVAQAAAPKTGGQNKNAGMLPPSESGSDESSEDESSDDDSVPMNEYLTQKVPKKTTVVVERDPEDIRKELERLEIVKKRREQDRLKRIEAEGWDRFAPVSETNKPPGQVPTDHPSHKS